MRWIGVWVFCGYAVVLLPGCGDGDELTRPREGHRAPPGFEASLVCLDPMGRIHRGLRPPRVYRTIGSRVRAEARRLPDRGGRDLSTAAFWFPGEEENGGRVLVVADGCRPQSLTLRNGLQHARLERGITVRVRVQGVPATKREPGAFGIAFVRRNVTHVGGIELGVPIDLEAVALRTLEEEHPRALSFEDLRWREESEIEMCFPTPGTWTVAWTLHDGGNHRTTIVEGGVVEIAEGTRDLFLEVPPVVIRRMAR